MPQMKSIKEVSKITGMSYSAVRRLCIQSVIIHIRIGKKYLINLEKLESYLNGEIESDRQKGEKR